VAIAPCQQFLSAVVRGFALQGAPW